MFSRKKQSPSAPWIGFVVEGEYQLVGRVVLVLPAVKIDWSYKMENILFISAKVPSRFLLSHQQLSEVVEGRRR